MSEWGGRRAQRLVALTLATYGTLCHLCMEDGATTADHVIPRKHGGDDSIENLRPAHKLCNERRGTHTVKWFRERYATHLVRPVMTVDASAFFKPDATGHPAQPRPLFFGQNKREASNNAEIDPETAAFFDLIGTS